MGDLKKYKSWQAQCIGKSGADLVADQRSRATKLRRHHKIDIIIGKYTPDCPMNEGHPESAGRTKATGESIIKKNSFCTRSL